MIRPVVFGKFILLERISVGGMAEVYRAKLLNSPHFTRFLAIKRILPNLAADKEFISMFIDEAKINVELNHPNICQIYELGRLDDAHYIVMEYIPGRDLLALQQHYRRQKKIMSVSQGCYVVAQLAQGLDFAHRATDSQGRPLGIIHRDVSPQNVLISYEGLVKLIDFGVAKAASKNSKTQAGVLMGKFGYMSPEQVNSGQVDRRSDVFALGTVLWELLTGRRLFQAETEFGTLELVRECDIKPPSEHNKLVPAQVEQIVMRALCPDPTYRYQWAGELARDLWMFLNACNPPYTQWHLQNWMCTTYDDDLKKEWEKVPIFQSINTADDARAYNEQELAKAQAEMDAQMASVRDFDGNVVPQLNDNQDEKGERTQVFTPSFDFANVGDDTSGALPKVPVAVTDDELEPTLEPTPDASMHMSIYQMDAMGMAYPQKRGIGGIIVAVLIFLILLGGAGAGAYWFLFLRNADKEDVEAPTTATVSVTVQPAHSEITVRLLADDKVSEFAKKLGAESEFAEVPPGTYFLEVDHPEYESETREVNLTAGSSMVQIDMLRKKVKKGTVKLTISPEDATVSVAGEEREEIGPERIYELIAGEEVEIVVKRAGYKPFITSVTPDPDTESAFEAVLEKGVGSVTIKSAPGRADVYVRAGEEWRKVGETPHTIADVDATVPLPIEVRKRGYKTWTKEVQFDEQFEKSYLATLTKE